ncbi:Indole-3-glycerol phosphate synthase, chloroplastic [Morella rubra]|uniref:indole-3-glycerol-phosphate synthase n=1 Tax=Morella rubra TaxID=262757 RepID=A0A6A1VBC9_9ROSI|nr:Indole-3-glycerol phosphate synthase, chloroplastic [Morella rubra]
MDGLLCSRPTPPSFTLRPNPLRRFIPGRAMDLHMRKSSPFASSSIRAQQRESKDGSAAVAPVTVSEENALEIKEWEVGMFHNEVAATQGIRIRRRPPSGPPLHYVGPFQFRLQNEGNTPRNILEEIIWHKDKEVSQLRERRPLSALMKNLDNVPPTRDFIGALRAANLRTGLPGLIAEVKKASPSRGVLREDFDPVWTLAPDQLPDDNRSSTTLGIPESPSFIRIEVPVFLFIHILIILLSTWVHSSNLN